MKFFLCSHTIDEKLKSEFEKFSGLKCSESKLAFIPTAANAQGIIDKSWADQDLIHLEATLGFTAERIDIDEIKGKELKEKLEKVDVIFVNGGFSGYLLRSMRASGFDKMLPELLNSGKIYVGSSAGTNAVSNENNIGEWFVDEPEKDASKEKGLGYLEYEIYPHFRDELLPAIRQHKKKNQKFILLRDGEAVGLEDGEITLFGKDIKLLI
jgi:dipeptidase E